MPDSDGYIRDAAEVVRLGSTTAGANVYSNLTTAFRSHNSTFDLSAFKISWEARYGFQQIIDAVVYNNDLFYNEQVPSMAFVGSGSGNTKILTRINMSYSTTTAQDSSWENTVISKAAEACASVKETANTAYGDIQRIFGVHQWICNNCHYDTTLQRGTAYHGFVDHTTVCRGYSRMVDYMCRNQNIPCYSISDNVHIWNMVYIDKRWYLMDATWDAGYDANTGYLPVGYDHFLVGDIEFNKSHVLDHTLHRCYSNTCIAPDFITSRFRLIDWSKLTRNTSGYLSNIPTNSSIGKYYWVADSPQYYNVGTRLTYGDGNDNVNNSDSYSNELLKSEYLDHRMPQLHWLCSATQAARWSAKHDGLSADQIRLLGSEMANRISVL